MVTTHNGTVCLIKKNKTQRGPNILIFTRAEVNQHESVTKKGHDNKAKFVSKHTSCILKHAAHQFFSANHSGGAYLQLKQENNYTPLWHGHLVLAKHV